MDGGLGVAELVKVGFEGLKVDALAIGEKAARLVEPVVAVRRDRDELTSFVSVAPTPEPVADATVAISSDPPGTPDGESAAASVSNDAPDSQSHGPELPDTSPVEPGDPETQPVRGDSEATLMLEIPPDTPDAPDQDATLFFEVPRAVVGKLIVIKGDLKGEEYELREGENQLGRSHESDVVLPSMWISRSHAVLRCEMGRAEIESTTDKITSVDGEPVSGSVAVADGAKIQLGGTVCRVEFER